MSSSSNRNRGKKRKRSKETHNPIIGPSTLHDFLWGSLQYTLRSNGRDPKQSLKKTGLKIWSEWAEHVRLMDNSGVQYETGQAVSMAEYKRVILTVACAVANPVTLPWDADRFTDKVVDNKVGGSKVLSEKDIFLKIEQLKKHFDLEKLGLKDSPCTIVDRHGRILTWHLPDILTINRVEDYNQAVVGMKDTLEVGDDDDNSWRLSGFVESTEEFGLGVRCYSPGWFMQVRDQQCETLHASPSVQHKRGRFFLSAISQVEHLCNSIVFLVAPDLHRRGNQAITKVLDGENVEKKYPNVELWPSCFTAMQVIVNRMTPPHRDTGGSPTLYDLLVSAGRHTGAKLECREIGLELAYGPGTVVLICGKILLHEVRRWEKGERICIAHMMKDNVHDRQEVPRPAWPCQSSYFPDIST